MRIKIPNRNNYCDVVKEFDYIYNNTITYKLIDKLIQIVACRHGMLVLNSELKNRCAYVQLKSVIFFC